MSDSQDAPDWWKAVDDRWYPPERHPDFVPPAPPPLIEPQGAPGPGKATDGQQYPPERHPEFANPPTLPAPSHAPPVARSAPWMSAPSVPSTFSGPSRTTTQTAVSAAEMSTNGFAIASLTMALVGFILFGVGGLLAIVFGHVARRQIRRSRGRQTGSGLALAGLILGYLQVIGGVILAVVTVIALGSTVDEPIGGQVRQDGQDTACRLEFEAMTTAAEAYRSETGSYPTSQTQLVGTYMFKVSTNYDFAPDGSGGVVTLAGSPCE